MFVYGEKLQHNNIQLFWGETISKAMLVKDDICTAIANFLVFVPLFVDIIA